VSRPTHIYVALLRGVNLGPARRIQMAALRELLGGHGHENVATYLQSGNIVLESSLTSARLEQTLETQLAAGLGFDVDVLVRTAQEMAEIVARNPLGAVAGDPARYLVTFLRKKPGSSLVERLTSAGVAPEVVVAAGRELYSWHPGGVGRSELGKLLQPKRLGLTASARNWRVVEQLSALARGR
jgi:uncharacterized protein (DUF1697 family)